jgi:hypothetical protein
MLDVTHAICFRPALAASDTEISHRDDWVAMTNPG